MSIEIKGKRYTPRWGRILLVVIAIIGAVDLLFIGRQTTHQTPYGSYECKGGLIKVCGTDRAEVYKYVKP